MATKQIKKAAVQMTPSKKQPSLTELGMTGTSIWQGMIRDEYNVDLVGTKGITIYDKMRRSDGMVRAVTSAIGLSIRSAKWDVIGSEGVDQNHIDFLKDAFFNRMSISFDDWLYHALLMVPFGFSPFEKVFKYEDGLVYWRKLAPRLPKSLYKWELDESGGLKGMIQYAFKGGRFQEIPIPVESLLLFTMDREGSNFEGTSCYRSAYKHWLIKDTLYKISGIGMERQAVGVPIITLPENADPKEIDAAEQAVEDLRANEKMGLVLPNGYVATILEGKLKASELLALIQHHDSMIAKCVLAEFLQLGQEGKGGSYALSKDKSDFFLMSCEGYTKNICDTVNRHAIPQLIDYNFPNVKVYPKLTASLGDIDKFKLAEALKSLSDGKIIVPDDSTEKYMREKMGLPEIDPATRRHRAETSTTPIDANAVIPPKKVAAHEHTHIRSIERTKKLAEGMFWRKLTKWEGSVKFKEIDDRWSKAEDALIKELKKIATWQSEDLLKQVEKAIETGKLNELYKLTVHYRGDYAETLRNAMKDLAEFGDQMASAETKVKLQEISTQLKNWLQIKADTIVDLHASKMKSTVMLDVLNSVNSGLASKAVLYNAKVAMQAYVDKELDGTASVVVGESINRGRNEIVASGEFQAAQYSAILDERTCDLCADMDSMVVDIDDPNFDRFTPPVHSNCRCIWVYIRKEEERVVIDWVTPDQAMIDKNGKLVA